MGKSEQCNLILLTNLDFYFFFLLVQDVSPLSINVGQNIVAPSRVYLKIFPNQKQQHTDEVAM